MQLEEQLSRLQREKNDLQSRMEEDQEDMNELMKKHKAAVAQVTLYGTHACQIAIQSLSVIIAHTLDLYVHLCFAAAVVVIICIMKVQYKYSVNI